MRQKFLTSITIAALLVAAPALAEGPKPFPEFTFKRIKPPKAGVKKRITVQVEPQVARITARPADDIPAPATDLDAGGFDWFWGQVKGDSPALRVSSGLLALQNATSNGVASPRLQNLRDIADRHGPEILKATIGTRISPAFALAVIAVESGGRSDALSRAGAQGLMQLMPATAERFGVLDRTIASDNIRGGVTYLDWLMGQFGGDPILALAGYNAGEGAVQKHGGVPPYAETRGYVPKVLAAWSVAKGLCLTPPQLISDGCVFVGNRAATNG
ncbi:lytic transglycosylase domain-containing protein [Oceaniglobus trochenteri]|uniref:lytic transglycosylase domain-containing protein n=1 Tax=Oceaniglobus trochenteri TaxID=2763260 RepID=UPI001CFFEC84|nr:lytic transglycosylase domain-containing protein [Oceaniglobus trochenteri]